MDIVTDKKQPVNRKKIVLYLDRAFLKWYSVKEVKPMTIGERIKAARKAKGLTQKQLGELCGINEANIRKYESNRQRPKIETLSKIARALGTDPYYLRGDPPPASDDYSDDRLVQAINKAAECINPKGVTGMRRVNLPPLSFEGCLDAGSTPLWRIARAFEYLNDDGVKVAVDRVEELMDIPKYQRKPGDEEDE